MRVGRVCRMLLLGSCLITAAGLTLLSFAGWSGASYFLGFVAVYIGTIVLESAGMSLMSKVVLIPFLLRPIEIQYTIYM